MSDKRRAGQHAGGECRAGNGERKIEEEDRGNGERKIEGAHRGPLLPNLVCRCRVRARARG
jgi:hypothetical protein